MALITSLNIPLVGGTRHVTVVDASTGIALPPSGVTWMSSPNASGLVNVIADSTGFVFTGLSVGQWTFTATFNVGTNPHVDLAVSVGPRPTAIAISDA